jgi:hypothetical protein
VSNQPKPFNKSWKGRFQHANRDLLFERIVENVIMRKMVKKKDQKLATFDHNLVSLGHFWHLNREFERA